MITDVRSVALLTIWLAGGLASLCMPVVAQTITTVINNGPSSNRIDIVIIGDGYTTADLGKYATDVQTFVLDIFQQQPFSEYKSYFNVHRVDAFSAESGID